MSEEHSNPGFDALLTLKGEVGGARADVRRLTEAVNKLEGCVAKKSDLETQMQHHTDTCKGRQMAEQIAAEPKLSGWALVQQRLAVFVSLLIILGMLGSAWYWSVSRYSQIEGKMTTADEKQKRREKRQRRLNEAIQREVKAELRTVLKEVRELKNGE